jgi:molybdopterin molybdotransferase
LAQAGHQNCFLPDLYLPLATNYSKPIDMTHFLKAKIVNDSVVILPHQESFNLLSFNDCTYIALLEERLAEFQAGERIALFRW